jgi:purine-binding chemotaxis protein CheW
VLLILSLDSKNNSANLGIHQKGNVDAYLVFRLNEHYFAVPEEQVNQILYLRKFNKIPGAKKNVIGVIDVRGKITTLLDLKRILNLKSPDQSQNKGNVILLNVAEDNIGMLVDQAIGLKYIAKNKIKRKLGLISSKIESKYLIGATKLDEKIIVLLNLDMLIPEYDKEVIIQSRGIKKKITTKTEVSDLELEEIPELQITEDEFVKYSD